VLPGQSWVCLPPPLTPGRLQRREVAPVGRGWRNGGSAASGLRTNGRRDGHESGDGCSCGPGCAGAGDPGRPWRWSSVRPPRFSVL